MKLIRKIANFWRVIPNTFRVAARPAIIGTYKVLFMLATAALGFFHVPILHAQQPLPNLTYNALLNSTCSTPNAFCANTANPPTSLAQTGLNGSALDVNSSNYAVATVTVSGTYSGAVINFDFSDPSGGTSYFQELCTRTDTNIIEIAETLPTNQARAWQCPVFATTRFRVRVSALASGSINTWITVTQTAIDPSPTIAQQGTGNAQSVFITLSTATTTQIIAAPPAGYRFYVTGVQLATTTAAAATVQIVYGTGANCGSGTTNLTPPISIATGTAALQGFSFHRDAPLVPAVTNAICATQAGTPGTVGVLITGYTAP